MLEISRTYSFSAAHSLPNVPDNHKCRRVHGHTWHATIWVKGVGIPDEHMGWIIDYADIDTVWEEMVFGHLDHRLLNEVIPNPTVENVASWIWTQMSTMLEGSKAMLTEIELTEGDGGGKVRLRE